MLQGPAYPAARLVAPKIHRYFARHHAAAVQRGRTDLAALPDAAMIEAVIEAAFWASLRREEGYVPRVSLALLGREAAERPLTFDRPLALMPAALTRVAPAVERSGIHLGVWREHGSDLCVWGTTDHIPPLCMVLEVAAPGLLVIKHHRGDESGKYINVAVLEGDQIKLVDERASILPDCPTVLPSLLGFDPPDSGGVDAADVLVQLAVSMRAHGRGGSLLVVPAGSDVWRESVVRPIMYAVSPPFAELANLCRARPDDVGRSIWQDKVSDVVAAIAGLTAVDGATVLTTQYEVLAFGSTITRRKGWGQVEQVSVTEPIEHGVAAIMHPELLGGTRHQSAAQFAHDQRDTVALVASHDGRFTVFAWSPLEQMVHAHRVEALLL